MFIAIKYSYAADLGKNDGKIEIQRAFTNYKLVIGMLRQPNFLWPILGQQCSTQYLYKQNDCTAAEYRSQLVFLGWID